MRFFNLILYLFLINVSLTLFESTGHFGDFYISSDNDMQDTALAFANQNLTILKVDTDQNVVTDIFNFLPIRVLFDVINLIADALLIPKKIMLLLGFTTQIVTIIRAVILILYGGFILDVARGTGGITR